MDTLVIANPLKIRQSVPTFEVLERVVAFLDVSEEALRSQTTGRWNTPGR